MKKTNQEIKPTGGLKIVKVLDSDFTMRTQPTPPPKKNKL